MASKTKQPAAAEAKAMYAGVVALNAQVHGGRTLRPSPTKFAFAAGLNSIPVAAVEAPTAAMDYPLVFGKTGDEAAIFAITGTKTGENRFVDAEGVWRAGTYVPAFVRRYPFILMSSPDGATLTLAVDGTSDMLAEGEGVALYADGKPTEAAQAALNFCTTLRTQLQVTAALVKSLEEAGLLVDRRAEVQLPGGEKTVLTGFSVVDEGKLQALDDETFLKLRKSGALVVIYAHLWSMRVWKNLLA